MCSHFGRLRPQGYPAAAFRPGRFIELRAYLGNCLTFAAPRRSSRSVNPGRAKPADLVDACWTRDAEPQKIVEVQVYGSGRCEKLYPSASFPRGVAGSPIAGDVIKCQVKPIDPEDYTVKFTDDEMSRLKKIFSSGVCNWSKSGLAQQALAGTWLTYGDNRPRVLDTTQ